MLNKQEKEDLKREYRETIKNIVGFLNHSLESRILQYFPVIKTFPSKNEITIFENDVKIYFQKFLHNPYINVANHYKKNISEVITNYSNLIRKDSWEEIHDFLITDHFFAINHLRNVIRNNWPLYEKVLTESMNVKRIYQYSLAVKLPKNLHNCLMANAIRGNRFAIRYSRKLEETNSNLA